MGLGVDAGAAGGAGARGVCAYAGAGANSNAGAGAGMGAGARSAAWGARGLFSPTAVSGARKRSQKADDVGVGARDAQMFAV